MTGPDGSLRVVACTLRPAAAENRIDRWRTLNRRYLILRHRQANRVALTYRREPGVEAEMADLVRLERLCCCRFLTFDVSREGAAVVLEVMGPEGSPILELFAAGS